MLSRPKQHKLFFYLPVITRQHVAAPSDEVCEITGHVADRGRCDTATNEFWRCIPPVGDEAHGEGKRCRNETSKEVGCED